MSTAQSSNILREYLMALGFRVNTTEERRMNDTIIKIDRKMMALGKGAVAAATAVVAVTTAVAKGWEKMFYAARYADTTVTKLQAVEFGARNIGLEAGRMTSAVKQFAGAIRGNPGLQGFLESMGVKVTGRTKEAVFLDFIEKLKSDPFFIAQRKAAMFGIGPEDLFNLEQGLDKMREAAKMREQMNKDAGLDADEAAKVGLEYMNLWRQVSARATVLAQVLMINVLPTVRELVGETDKLLIKWTSIVNEIQKAGTEDFWKKMREGITGKAEGDRVKLTPEAKARLGLPEKDQIPRVQKDDGSFADDTVGIAKAWDDFKRWREQRGAKRAGKMDPYADRPATDNEAVYNSVDNSDFHGKAAPAGPIGNSWELSPRYPQGTKQINPLTPEEAAFLASLEKKYGLPAGLLDRVYVAESGRGKNLHSRAGATGPFQFMPKTAAEYNLQNPMDFKQSADAAARKYRDLMNQFGGDVELAAAGYNWGQGNMARQGLGKMPDETRDYVKKVAGDITIQQDVNIHVHGSGDPHETAQSVVRLQNDLANNLIRNNSPKVR